MYTRWQSGKINSWTGSWIQNEREKEIAELVTSIQINGRWFLILKFWENFLDHPLVNLISKTFLNDWMKII